MGLSSNIFANLYHSLFYSLSYSLYIKSNICVKKISSNDLDYKYNNPKIA